jgi:4-hydroxybenzoate polyprenyltransferase
MTNEVNSDRARGGALLAWMQLMRLPNVFTAAADVTMGFFFVAGSLQPIPVYLCVLGASCLLYTSGMVLNDLFDLADDRQKRPERPLPSGRVSVKAAAVVGFGMLALGMLLGWITFPLAPEGASLAWRGGAVATALATCVLLYDGVLKHTFVGPFAMGACRFLNVLLGMSMAMAAAGGTGNVPIVWLGFDKAQLLVAGGIGIYITGVTVFARREEGQSNRIVLIGGTVMMLCGIALLGTVPIFHLPMIAVDLQRRVYWLLLALLAGGLLVRASAAIFRPVPARVQIVVKHCIMLLIVLDGAVCAAAHSGRPWYAIGIVALLFPAMLLGRWVYST